MSSNTIWGGTDKMFESMRNRNIEAANPAIGIADTIISSLKEFQSSLNDDQEMEVSIAGLPVHFSLLHVSREGAHLLVFEGEQPGGFKTRAILHCSQVVIAMTVRMRERSKAIRIGFGSS